jgi:uncharacterized coiled-coil DUF342 family protein
LIPLKQLRPLSELKNDLKQLHTSLDSSRAANDSLLKLIADNQYLIDSLDVIVEDSKNKIYWLNKRLKELEDEIVDP